MSKNSGLGPINLISPFIILINCKISELSGNLPIEMKKAILKKAAIYKTQNKEKNSDNNYTYPKVTDSKF